MTEKKNKRSNFSGGIGFVLAAAGSAVGLGNIWRFPYLAAKDGGGLFILTYIILAFTFGFALLTTEIAIGRNTAQGPLTAYGKIHKGWGFIGAFAWLVPIVILPYYCVIGGWVLKYLSVFFTNNLESASSDSYFVNYITSEKWPLIGLLIFAFATSVIVFCGVDKGIEKFSKILMPILLILIICIACFSLTLKYTDDTGVTRTGIEGLKIYIIPDFKNITFSTALTVIMDAMGQLFFSISVAMGIMVAYGSYVKKETNLMKSINQIEIFDTIVALLAGMMIVPAVFTFMGRDGMQGGPGLMFVSLPKVFNSMGRLGVFIGALFFVMVTFAALTSSVSIMEAIVSSIMDKFHLSRKKAASIVAIYAAVVGVIVCLGYNKLYFEVKLPNGSKGQILDIMDYISNSCLMPIVALLTCILIGWVVKPRIIIDEVTLGGFKFARKMLYIVMIKFIAPIMLFALLLQSLGIIRF